MITAALQMLVFVATASAFAWAVLRIDKHESRPHAKPDDIQRSIEFPAIEDRESKHHAAMSQL
jgi:hypothetical protein